MEEEEVQQERQQHRLRLADAFDVDRQSVQYLVEFLSGETHQVTELELWNFHLLQPPGDSLNVLCDFFTNQTTLTKVTLFDCSFGCEQGTSQLIVALQTTSSVTWKVLFMAIVISVLLQNMPHLQRLEVCDTLNEEIIRAFQPGLRTNRHLKVLDLCGCRLGDAGLHLIVDALVGNTTIEVLDVSHSNNITSNGLVAITRLLESTQLRKISFGYNDGLFDDNTATQNFAHVLSRNQYLNILVMFMWVTPNHAAHVIFQALESNTILEQIEFGLFRESAQALDRLIESLPRIKALRRLEVCLSTWIALAKNPTFRNCFVPALQENTSLEELPFLDRHHFPQHKATILAVNNILSRNQSMRRAKALLGLQPCNGLPIASKSGIWHKAMAKLAEQESDEQQVQSDDAEDGDDDSDSDGMNDSNSEEQGPGEDKVQTDDEEYNSNDDDMNDSDATAASVGKEGPTQDELQSDGDDGEDDDNDSDHGPAAVVAYPGASAIYKILQTRPAIFEKQLHVKRRPTSSFSLHRQPPPPDSKCDNHRGTNDKTRKSVEVEIKDGQKRPRL